MSASNKIKFKVSPIQIIMMFRTLIIKSLKLLWYLLMLLVMWVFFLLMIVDLLIQMIFENVLTLFFKVKNRRKKEPEKPIEERTWE